MSERTGATQTGFPFDAFNSSNPVARYGVATLVVFGALYIAQSFGLPVAWPIAVVVGLGFLIFRQDKQRKARV